MTRSLNAFGLISLTVILLIAGVIYFMKEDVPTLYINELMANNTLCCPDRQGDKDEYDDWVEIYNPGESPVDLGGMYVSQDKDNPLGYQIPKTNAAATTIPPKGHLLLWADGSTEQGELHLKFKLNQQGEYFGLNYEDGRKIDGVKFSRQSENFSYGRVTDGASEWKVFSIPTPGKSNQ